MRMKMLPLASFSMAPSIGAEFGRTGLRTVGSLTIAWSIRTTEADAIVHPQYF
jgi:hypothetical protein